MRSESMIVMNFIRDNAKELRFETKQACCCERKVLSCLCIDCFGPLTNIPFAYINPMSILCDGHRLLANNKYKLVRSMFRKCMYAQGGVYRIFT